MVKFLLSTSISGTSARRQNTLVYNIFVALIKTLVPLVPVAVVKILIIYVNTMQILGDI